MRMNGPKFTVMILTLAAVLLICTETIRAIQLASLPETSKSGSFRVFASEIEEETVIAPLDENSAEIPSGMPCENWRERYEQTTVEEAYDEALRDYLEDCPEGDEMAEVQDAEMETEGEAPVPIYRISGYLVDPDIQVRLHSGLEAVGITSWYEIALCQLFQESHGDRYAVSPDGQDYGLFQFRKRFWTQQEDIFDIDAQIRVYCQQMAARLAAGLSTDEAISRHYTSDYVTEIAWDYVNQVKQWLSTMEVMK